MTTDEKYFTCDFCLNCKIAGPGRIFCHHQGGYSETTLDRVCCRPNNYTPFGVREEYRLTTLRDACEIPRSVSYSKIHAIAQKKNEEARQALKNFLENYKINQER